MLNVESIRNPLESRLQPVRKRRFTGDQDFYPILLTHPTSKARRFPTAVPLTSPFPMAERPQMPQAGTSKAAELVCSILLKGVVTSTLSDLKLVGVQALACQEASPALKQ